ncbi:MAG TPA: NAD(+)/NADH kinase, partial [Candidatus Acidoferrales bacterium]|nr:NAD(+)/NADH kinase [Candidatus Acidoferrales bacterium]
MNTEQTVGLYVDLAREHARTVAARVAGIFRDAGFGIALRPDQRDALGIATDGSPLESAALLIAIGGDGTLLRASRIAIHSDVPLLGINTGRLGFLTELDQDDERVNDLPKLLQSGSIMIEPRVALEAEYEGRTFVALNDVVVRKGEVSRIVPFGIRFDEQEAARIPADGICIATPTGSTAYFLSAGGSIISPGVKAFGVVPLLPHTLFSRPLIVPVETRIEITCDLEIARAHLECDGDVLAEVAPGSTVHIRCHPKSVRFARISSFN